MRGGKEVQVSCPKCGGEATFLEFYFDGRTGEDLHELGIRAVGLLTCFKCGKKREPVTELPKVNQGGK